MLIFFLGVVAAPLAGVLILVASQHHVPDLRLAFFCLPQQGPPATRGGATVAPTGGVRGS